LIKRKQGRKNSHNKPTTYSDAAILPKIWGLTAVVTIG